MNNRDVVRGADEFPYLNNLGFRVFATSSDEHAMLRKELLASREDDLTAACEWIASRQTAASRRRFGSSYYLKHAMERQTGLYVMNGLFIACALHLGIPFKRLSGPNALLGILEAERSEVRHG